VLLVGAGLMFKASKTPGNGSYGFNPGQSLDGCALPLMSYKYSVPSRRIFTAKCWTYQAFPAEIVGMAE